MNKYIANISIIIDIGKEILMKKWFYSNYSWYKDILYAKQFVSCTLAINFLECYNYFMFQVLISIQKCYFEISIFFLWNRLVVVWWSFGGVW